MLQEPHPLHDSHYLVRRAKWGTLAPAGKPPPKEPDADKPDTRARRRARREFARYYVALFVPWSMFVPPELTYEFWQAHITKLEETACLHGPRSDDEQAEMERKVAACRLDNIECWQEGFTAPRVSHNLGMKAGSRYDGVRSKK